MKEDEHHNELHGQGTENDPVRVGRTDDSDARVLRFVHISDTHDEDDQLDIPAGDVLVHSGDFIHWRKSNDFDADVARLSEFFDRQPHAHKVCRLRLQTSSLTVNVKVLTISK